MPQSGVLRDELNKYRQQEADNLRKKNYRQNILRFIWSIVWKVGILVAATVLAIHLENKCNLKFLSYIFLCVDVIGIIFTIQSSLKNAKEKYLKDTFKTTKEKL